MVKYKKTKNGERKADPIPGLIDRGWFPAPA